MVNYAVGSPGNVTIQSKEIQLNAESLILYNSVLELHQLARYFSNLQGTVLKGKVPLLNYTVEENDTNTLTDLYSHCCTFIRDNAIQQQSLRSLVCQSFFSFAQILLFFFF